MHNKFKIGICQMDVVNDKNKNIEKAISMIERAAKRNCKIVMLPEMFTCPYVATKFKDYAEVEEESGTLKIMSKTARQFNVDIIAGTIPELSNGKIYNTSYIFNNEGNIIGKHRKIHLFDVDVENLKFKESKYLSPGNQITTIETKVGKIGVAICYDVRFPEIFKLMSLDGAKIIFVPAAFNTVTGPEHWEILMRARAVDNQIYIVASSPARNSSSGFLAYGNSIITNPWGHVVKKAGINEELIIGEIDLDFVEDTRNKLPILNHMRNDVYSIKPANNS